MQQTMVVALVMYVSTIAAVRISILLLYTRIFRTRSFEFVCFGICTLTACWWLAAVTVNIFQCYPISAAWTTNVFFAAQCIDFPRFLYGISATNLAMDLVLLAMPLYMVWHLRTRLGRKVLLCAIFSIGCL